MPINQNELSNSDIGVIENIAITQIEEVSLDQYIESKMNTALIVATNRVNSLCNKPSNKSINRDLIVNKLSGKLRATLTELVMEEVENSTNINVDTFAQIDLLMPIVIYPNAIKSIVEFANHEINHQKKEMSFEIE